MPERLRNVGRTVAGPPLTPDVRSRRKNGVFGRQAARSIYPRLEISTAEASTGQPDVQKAQLRTPQLAFTSFANPGRGSTDFVESRVSGPDVGYQCLR